MCHSKVLRLSELFTYLFLSYPSTFVDDEFRNFFLEYISRCPFSSLIDDEKQFFKLRAKLLAEPTNRQSQAASDAVSADKDNDQSDAQIKQQETTKTSGKNYGDKFFMHYTHEQRFKTLKREIHQVYDNAFQNTPAMYTRMIVGTRNRRDMKNELIRKRPKRTFLQNRITQRKSHSKLQPPKTDFHNYDLFSLISFFLRFHRQTKEDYKAILSPEHG